MKLKSRPLFSKLCPLLFTNLQFEINRASCSCSVKDFKRQVFLLGNCDNHITVNIRNINYLLLWRWKYCKYSELSNIWVMTCFACSTVELSTLTGS